MIWLPITDYLAKVPSREKFDIMLADLVEKIEEKVEAKVEKRFNELTSSDLMC